MAGGRAERPQDSRLRLATAGYVGLWNRVPLHRKCNVTCSLEWKHITTTEIWVANETLISIYQGHNWDQWRLNWEFPRCDDANVYER
jgi:hypothetical protein